MKFLLNDSIKSDLIEQFSRLNVWSRPSVIIGMIIACMQPDLIATRQMSHTFASGGIVTNDIINARPNLGEMILNEKQQAQLNKNSSKNVNVKVFIGEKDLKEVISKISIDNRTFKL